MKPFVSIWKIRRISLWMKFSICLRTDIWDGWVLSGHQLAAPSPHFWSFDPRFSRKTESHPYLLEGKFRKRKSPIMVGIALVRELWEKTSQEWTVSEVKKCGDNSNNYWNRWTFFNLDNIKVKQLASPIICAFVKCRDINQINQILLHSFLCYIWYVFSKEWFDKGIIEDEKELERIFAIKNTKKK